MTIDTKRLRELVPLGLVCDADIYALLDIAERYAEAPEGVLDSTHDGIVFTADDQAGDDAAWALTREHKVKLVRTTGEGE